MKKKIFLLFICFLVTGCVFIERTQFTNKIKEWQYREPSALTISWGQPLLTYNAGESVLFLYMRPLSLSTSSTEPGTTSMINGQSIYTPGATSFGTENYSCPVIFEAKNNRITNWYYKFGNCVLKRKPSLWDSFWR